MRIGGQRVERARRRGHLDGFLIEIADGAPVEDEAENTIQRAF
jgi:hypothetical protein